MSPRVLRKGPEAVGEDGYLTDSDDAHGRQRDGVHERHRKRKRIAFATCTDRSVPTSTRKVIIGLVQYVRPVHEYQNEYGEEGEGSQSLEQYLDELYFAMISDPLMCMVGGGCCYSTERTPIKSHRE